MLVALKKKNPLKGLSFHAVKVNTEFLLGARTVSLSFTVSMSLFLS